MKNEEKGILFSILSRSLSISPVLIRLSLYTINPETTNMLQTLFSSVMFVLLFIVLRKTNNFKNIIKNWKGPAIIGLLAFVASLLYTYGILLAGPTTASFVIQFATIFTIFLGIAFLKERFTKLEGFGVLLAVIGLLVMSYENIEIQYLSIIVILGGSLIIAVENIFSKKFLKNENPITLAGGRSMFMFLFFFVFSVLSGRLQTNLTMASLGYTFLAAVTGIFLNFILSFKSLKLIEVSKSVAVGTIGPFFVTIYSFIILSLIPTLNQLLGGILIIIGIISLSLIRKKQQIRA